MLLIIILIINSIMQIGIILNKEKFRWYLIIYCFAEPIFIIILWMINKFFQELSTTEIYLSLLIVIVIKQLARAVYKNNKKSV